jgi:hypothetical protein
MCSQPELAGRDGRAESCFFPPSEFVAAAVDFAVMAAAKRDGELVADLATERAALGEAKVVRIGGRPTAD